MSEERKETPARLTVQPGLGVSLADAFAIATAQDLGGSVASFDRRVRRAATQVGVPVRG